MNTLHLKYAIEVARTGSISQAAENLYMAQPNLSKAIKELEDTLGIVIFERNSRGVEPTKTGKKFLEYANSVIDRIEKMESLKKADDETVKTLSISSVAVDYVKTSFSEFLLSNTVDAAFTFETKSSLGVINDLLSGKSDIGIIRYKSSDEKYFLDYLAEHKLKSQPLWRTKKVAIVSKKNTLANINMRSPIMRSNLGAFELCHNIGNIPYVNSRPEPKNGFVSMDDETSLLELLQGNDSWFMVTSPVAAKTLERYSLSAVPIADETEELVDIVVFPEHYRFEPLELSFLDTLYSSKNSIVFSQ